MIAFIMINTSAGAEEEVFDQLSKMEGILEAHLVYGVYDIIVKAQIQETKDKEDIVGRIRQLKKVQSTMTLVVIKAIER
ncbi:MAG: Lrp/AsnC ligand binding domain-containing protein [Candidatus Methanosuratincola sp.]|nr:Lrp/AsnC family transcriptional regulator [Candidatus Methanosuratincola sp.]